MGHQTDQQSLSIAVSDSFFSEAEKHFFRIRFRDKRSFTNFTRPEYFPYESHLLRLLDLTVLKGNDIEATNPGKTALGNRKKFGLWNGEQIILDDSFLPGPYQRLRTSTDSIPYDQKLLLRNLEFVFTDLNRISFSTESNCLHSIDSGFCLVCNPSYVESKDHRSCSYCENSKYMDYSTNKCLDLGKYQFSAKGVKGLGAKYFTHTNTDIVDTGELWTRESKVYYYNENNDYQSSLSENINNSTNPKLSSPKMFMMNFSLAFSNAVDAFFNNPYVFLNLAHPVQESRYVQYLTDDISFNTSSKKVWKRQSLTVNFEDTSSFFTNMNFIMSENRSANFFVYHSGQNQIFEFYKIPESDYLSFLNDSAQFTDGKIVSAGFSLSPKTKVYSSLGLFVYEAFDVLFENLLDPGFYVEKSGTFFYTRKCPNNCLKCNSFNECIICEDSYFLRNRECVQCASHCLKCENHQDNCTQKNISFSIKECKLGQFLDAFGNCESCPDSCLECIHPYKCISCHFLFDLVDGESLPLDLCSLVGHPNPLMHSSCTDCAKNCLFCKMNSGQCVICEFGYFLEDSQCSRCSFSCLHCLDSDTCFRCQEPFSLENGFCIFKNRTETSDLLDSIASNSLPSNDKIENNAIELELEISNQVGCNFQSQNMTSQCFLCFDQYYLDSQMICRKCSDHCKRCLNDRFCLKCFANFELEYDQASSNVFCKKPEVEPIKLF